MHGTPARVTAPGMLQPTDRSALPSSAVTENPLPGSRRDSPAGRDQLSVDREQLVYPVGAGVPLANGPEAAGRERGREGRVIQHALQLATHLLAVAGQQKILARGEETLGVLPRS